jgi:hypothetical protein
MATSLHLTITYDQISRAFMNMVSNNRNHFFVVSSRRKTPRYDDHDDPIGFLRRPQSSQHERRLCDKGGGSGALVAPGGGQDTDGLVVARQTVNAGLDQNEAELGVLVLAVTLKVLADSDGLCDSFKVSPICLGERW